MIFATLILIGCWVYCILAIVGTLRYLRKHPAASASAPMPISILKPLSGLDEGLEENLRSFFEQDYIGFEILFGVRQNRDPAVPVVRALMA